MNLLRSAASLGLLLLTAMAAAAAEKFDATPVPAGTPIQSMRIGSPTADECGLIYDNTTNFSGYYYGVATNVEVSDDLHMLSGGNLCSFDFAYYKGDMGTTSATVRFFANDPADNPPVVIVAGPYTIDNLPGAGAYLIHVDTAPASANATVAGTNGVPPQAAVPPDVWMGVALASDGAGLLIMDPPTVGASDDYFWQMPPGDYRFFGGNPTANFGLGVHAAIATPTRPSTWGRVKQLYR